MGRWTQYSEDPHRLPAGVTRTSYDADTGRYTFQDTNGETYFSQPEHDYGELIHESQLNKPELQRSRSVGGKICRPAYDRPVIFADDSDEDNDHRPVPILDTPPKRRRSNKNSASPSLSVTTSPSASPSPSSSPSDSTSTSPIPASPPTPPLSPSNSSPEDPFDSPSDNRTPSPVPSTFSPTSSNSHDTLMYNHDRTHGHNLPAPVARSPVKKQIKFAPPTPEPYPHHTPPPIHTVPPPQHSILQNPGSDYIPPSSSFQSNNPFASSVEESHFDLPARPATPPTKSQHHAASSPTSPSQSRSGGGGSTFADILPSHLISHASPAHSDPPKHKGGDRDRDRDGRQQHRTAPHSASGPAPPPISTFADILPSHLISSAQPIDSRHKTSPTKQHPHPHPHGSALSPSSPVRHGQSQSHGGWPSGAGEREYDADASRARSHSMKDVGKKALGFRNAVSAFKRHGKKGSDEGPAGVSGGYAPIHG